MEFKGKGNHSVNELESICLDYKEKLHQKQLSNQELLEASIRLVELIETTFDYKELRDLKQVINK